MRALLNIFVGLAALTIPGACAAATLKDLCVFETADQGVSANISWQATATERASSVVDDYQTIQSLFETIRSFQAGWETPVGIWPQNATMINVDRHKEPICQIVYDRDSLYVALKDDAGFLRRDLSASEYSSVHVAMPPPVY